MSDWIVSSCIVILVVLALRAGLGRRISARLRYALWAVVLIRLLMPASIGLAVTVPKLPAWTPPEVLREESIYVLPVDSRPVEESGVFWTEDGTAMDPYSLGYPRLTGDGERVVRYAGRISPLELAKWLWLGGGIVLGTVLAASNLRFSVRLRRSRRRLEGAGGPIPVYVSAGLPSPCLFGLLRPAVYITEMAAEDPVMLRHVTAHELTHYRHLDHLWSVLRGVALAIHWWNPLVWLAVVLSRRDGELACDEGALRQLGDSERTAYGETLLTLVTAKSRPQDLLSFATTMSGGKRSLTERIRRIACQPKQLVSAVVAIAAVLTLTVLCAFGRAAEGEHPGPRAADLEVLSCSPDLDRDGRPETVQILHNLDDDLDKWRLEVFYKQEDDFVYDSLWSDTLDESHGGCNTYFLCQEDGLDYLLEYMPKMQQGQCTYSYRLFHLEGGEEVTDRENRVEFDINFDSPSHRFVPEEIAAFMWEVNGLIGNSQLLINTNHWMLNLEEDNNGRLRDNILISLNHKGSRDFGSEGELLASLEDYASYAGDHPDDVSSPLGDLLAGIEAADIGDISGQDQVTAAGLAALLREAERGSRFHTFDRFVEEEAWTWSTAEWQVPITIGGTLYLLACDSGNIEIGYETGEGYTSAFYDGAQELYDLITEVGEPYYLEELPYTVNLDRDRSPDKLVLRSDKPSGGAYWSLQCRLGSGERWQGEAAAAHPGWKAFFLCRLDGKDYLLEYVPYTGMGTGGYNYKLFYLEEGREVVVQENELIFDMNFGMEGERDFDPKAIAAFMDEINGLLEHSTLLLNTDPQLAKTFEQEGRLYDSLWWLEETREADKSLLENLLIYRNRALEEAAVPEPYSTFSEIQAADILDTGRAGLTGAELAGALHSAAGEWCRDGREDEFPDTAKQALTVTYRREGDYGEQVLLLETGGPEEIVRVTLSGQATALVYSENPANDGTYLRDVPYQYTIYAADPALYQLVCQQNYGSYAENQPDDRSPMNSPKEENGKKWEEENEKKWEEEQAEEYQGAGVTVDGKNYYYQGQLVNIFLDVRANKSFYTLDMNPAGSVSIKIIRNEKNEITGVDYMTDAEVKELLEDME